MGALVQRFRRRVCACLVATPAILFAMPAQVSAQSGILAYILGVSGSPESQIVTVVNTTTNAVVTTIPVGKGCGCLVDAERIVISPDGSRVYVANGDQTISIINTATNTVVDTISLGRQVDALAIAPSGARLYAVSSFPYPPAQLLVIDTTTKAIVASVPFSGGPHGIAISKNGARVYLSIGDTSGTMDIPRIKVVDTALNAIVATIDVGAPYPAGTRGVYPLSLDLSPDGSRLYMSDFFSAKLIVVDTATNSLLTTVETGSPVPAGSPGTVGFTPASARTARACFWEAC